MPRRLAGSTRWTWAAAAACFAATLFFAVQLLWPADGGAERRAAAPETGATAANGSEPAAFAPQPAERYAEITERPLFQRSRRPAEVAAAGDAQGGSGGIEDVPAARLSLSGVVLTSGRRTALLRLDDDPKVVHVSEGEEAGGWLIESIRADKVVVRRGDASDEIILDYTRGGAAAPGRAAGAVKVGGPPAATGGGARPKPAAADPSGESPDDVDLGTEAD